MKKIIKIGLTLVFTVFAIAVIYYIYWPFAYRSIHESKAVGDAFMHLANIISFKRDHPFPIMAWKSEWAGHPVVEGSPWLHYYTIQPLLPFFNSVGLAMDYYSAAFLLLYYVISFLLLYYVSKNAFMALFFSLVLIYGADSQFPFTINAFMTFTSTQFMLPLILLLIIIARNKNSLKILLLPSILLSLSFYFHGSLTGYIIIPTIIPLLLLNKNGKISKKSISKTFLFFLIFGFLSLIQIYQFIDYSAQGYLRGVKPFPLDTILPRLFYLFSWQNPVLLPLVVILLLLLITATVKRKFSRVKPYFFSLLMLSVVFTLMLFNITSMNLVLLAERVLWSLSLIILLLFAKIVSELVGLNFIKSMLVGLISLIATATYLYFTLVVKPPHLVPDTLRDQDPYKYKSVCVGCTTVGTKSESDSFDPSFKEKTINKYDTIYLYPQPSWSFSFDNYRTDGINWAVYSSWNIRSSNQRYKGRFPAAKNLPLEWSGLVSAAEYGRLGEAGSVDASKWALNQTIFFLDWYAIRHLEIVETDWPDYFRKEPLIVSSEESGETFYNTIAEKYVGPLYAPTDVKTMAVVSPELQYDNFVRTLSYSNFNSQRVIPIYLGTSLGSLNRGDLKYFDAIFLYGYKEPIFTSGIWDTLFDYVKNGGKLIIETGQKVPESQSARLPEVFPVKATTIEVIGKPWNVEIGKGELTKGIERAGFSPLKTKYLPYAISEVKPENLKNWAQPVLAKDGNIVMAYGQLEKGSVAWSGLNLPFHAIDNRNVSETVVFANILNWFFPKTEESISNFQVEHPNPEKIIVKSDQGKGVLLKENYSSGWSAKLNGKNTKIYKAGLFEMYIPFSSRGENEVNLTYQGVPLHWALFAISSATFFGVLTFLLFNINPLLIIKKIYRKRKQSDEEY